MYLLSPTLLSIHLISVGAGLTRYFLEVNYGVIVSPQLSSDCLLPSAGE